MTSRMRGTCYLCFFAFYFPPFTTPLDFSKRRAGSFLESDLCWREGRWQQPQTSPVLLLDHVSLKSLEDLCAGDPRSPPESGSLAAQSLLKAPTCDADPSRTIPHLRDTVMAKSALRNCNDLSFRDFFSLIF